MSRQEQIDMYMKYMDIVKREGKDEFIKWLIDDTVLFERTDNHNPTQKLKMYLRELMLERILE